MEENIFDERMALTIGLSVGVVGAVAIVVTVVLVYIFCCRKRKCPCLEDGKPSTQISKTKEDYMYVQADHDITRVPLEKDEGMVDNILYEPFGGSNSTEMTKRTDGTVYADVHIESDNRGGQNGSYIRQETPSVVYSEVRLENAYSEVRPNPDSASTDASNNPDSAYVDVTVKANVEAQYSVVNKRSSKGPPVPPKLQV